MTATLTPLRAPPTSRTWTLLGTENGRMLYRARCGRVYAQCLRTGRWWRVEKAK